MTWSHPSSRDEVHGLPRSGWLETFIAALVCVIVLMVIAVACPTSRGRTDDGQHGEAMAVQPCGKELRRPRPPC